MALAPQTYNPGSRGQNARYDIRNLQRGDRGFFDGQYWYDENGLSLDRPDALIQGLRPADQMDDRAPWDPGLGGGSSNAAQGFSRAPSGGPGQMPWFGYEGQAPGQNALAGLDLFSADNAQQQQPGPDPLTAALAELVAKVPAVGRDRAQGKQTLKSPTRPRPAGRMAKHPVRRRSRRRPRFAVS